MPSREVRESSSDGTTMAAESEPAFGRRRETEADLLVIAWYPEEPERAGEIAVIPATGAPLMLGRGEAEGARVLFFRPRPGLLEPQPPLASRFLSRDQLKVSVHADGMRIERVGKCPMHVNGVPRDVAVLRPGDTVRLRQTLVLLCTRRSARIAPLRYLEASRAAAFGAADASGIVGESPPVWELRDRLAFAAKSGAHVLLTGESGTGKELAARAIHRLSARAAKTLVARNAATLPAGLIDAELFGNVKNYPNPGMVERPGLIGQADQGYLFLDEIGELPADLQAHLLRVVDAGGEYQRLGDSVVRRSNLCLLAATNRDAGELKHDFAARFTIRIDVPPLAQRREDIPWLIHHVVRRAAEKSPAVAARFVSADAEGRVAVRADARLVDALLRREFPANTRDLEAVLWHAMGESEGDTLAWTAPATARAPAAPSDPKPPRPRRNSEPPAEDVHKALAQAEGNVARAAEALGLTSRHALYRLMAKLGIERGR